MSHQPTGFDDPLPPIWTLPIPVPAVALYTVTGVGFVAAVVTAIGKVVPFVGTMHVPATTQAALGAVVAVADVMLPVIEKVPESLRVWLPVVKVVAVSVTCHPAPEPVASTTTYPWSALVES